MFVILAEMSLVVLIMSRADLRVAKCDVGGKSSDEEIVKSLNILKWRRRVSKLVDYVTLIFVFLGLTVGTTVVVVLARFA